MGKRSNFKRNPRDFYVTPEKAVAPLVPHLKPAYYIDPCYGTGAIPKHLQSLGYAGLATETYDLYLEEYTPFDTIKADATKAIYPPYGDYFITNPPWDRKILHQIIDNLAGQKPTWLLFDADWMHTKQAIPYLKYCVKIVSVGRVSWMGNGVSGVDNCCWYLFDKSFEGQTQLIGRAA